MQCIIYIYNVYTLYLYAFRCLSRNLENTNTELPEVMIQEPEDVGVFSNMQKKVHTQYVYQYTLHIDYRDHYRYRGGEFQGGNAHQKIAPRAY